MGLYLIFSLLEPYFFDNELSAAIWKYFFIVMAIIGQLALNELLKGLHKIYTLSLFSVLPLFVYLCAIYIINLKVPVNIDYVIFGYYLVLLVFIMIFLLRLRPSFKFKKKLIAELLKENKTNGKPIYFGSLAGVATAHIAGFSISYFMDNTQVGFFMLSLTICSPLLVVPSLLGTIYFKEFVHLQKIPIKVIRFSLLITILAVSTFYLLIKEVVVIFYTESYIPVVDISKFLLIGFIFHGFGDLLNRFLGAKGKGAIIRNAAYAVGIINVLGYTFLIKYFNLNGAIITKILASGLYLALMLYYYNNFTKNKEHVH